MTFASARAACQAYGADLASFTSKTQFETVASHYSDLVLGNIDYLDTSQTVSSYRFWIGLSDAYSEGWFYWLDSFTSPDTEGSAFNGVWSGQHFANYNFSDVGQILDPTTLNCVSAHVQFLQWTDSPCTATYFPMCSATTALTAPPPGTQAPPPPTLAAPSITGSTFTYSGYDYTLSSGSATFTAAEAACVAAGGHLASFKTAAEQTAVLNAFNSAFESGPVAVDSKYQQVGRYHLHVYVCMCCAHMTGMRSLARTQRSSWLHCIAVGECSLCLVPTEVGTS